MPVKILFMMSKVLFEDYIYCSLVVFKSLILREGMAGDKPKRKFGGWGRIQVKGTLSR